MGLFSSDAEYEEPIEFTKARKALLAIGQNRPEFDVRKIAGMSDAELSAQDILSGYVTNQSPEVAAALASLGEAGKVTNLMDIPEYKALYDTGRTDISKDINRIGRTLQLGGNTNTSTGASVINNSIGEANARLLSTLAPYASVERERRFQAPITAAEIASSDTKNRLEAAKTYGALPREIQQLSLDAEYMAQYLNEIAPFEYQVPALSAVGGIGNATVTGGGLTDLGFALQTGASIFGG